MEFEYIRWLRDQVARHPRVPLGIGDDAALVSWPAATGCLVTVDVLMDRVDFDLREHDPRRVGHKALGINLSDIAAMAGRPIAAVIGLVLPRSGGRELGERLFEGMQPLAERHGVALAGGDTNSWDGPLVISITVLGEPTGRGPLRRSGARPGDRLLVTGSLGGSILGRHLDVEPRVAEAQQLHQQFELHAGVDISDGLSADVMHILEESGVGAELATERIPLSAAAEQLASQDGRSALQHALGDGEDFELVLAVEPDSAAELIKAQPLAIPVTDIGCVIAEAGLWQLDAQGNRQPLPVTGYRHAL